MLDVRTVAFLLVLTLGVSVVVHAVNWRMHPQLRGPGWWTAGGATLITADLAILSWPGPLKRQAAGE